MHGLNMYDFHWRMYCPLTARTTTPDPMAELFPHVSPYAWVLNNFPNRIDPDGRITRHRDGEPDIEPNHHEITQAVITNEGRGLDANIANQVLDHVTVSRNFFEWVNLPWLSITAHASAQAPGGNPNVRVIVDADTRTVTGTEVSNSLGTLSVGTDGSVVFSNYGVGVGFDARNYIFDLSIPTGRNSSVGVTISLDQQVAERTAYAVSLIPAVRKARTAVETTKKAGQAGWGVLRSVLIRP